jgi:inorganic pyrophosphatase
MLLNARVVGDLQIVDHKIISVLENDNFWGGAKDIADLPQLFIVRRQHYFST